MQPQTLLKEKIAFFEYSRNRFFEFPGYSVAVKNIKLKARLCIADVIISNQELKQRKEYKNVQYLLNYI